MQLRRLPVACVQTQANDRNDFETHWPRILALVDDAVRQGARLIVLPEGTVPAYVLGEQPIDPIVLALAERDLARIAAVSEVTIVYGGARLDDGRTYNGANVIGPDGRDLGFAAKQFLWHFDRRWFAAGATLAPVETPVGRLGLLICADGRIPTIAHTLVERGAEILVMPTAWVTSGRDPAVLENLQADLMANVRARENGVPFAAANKCGVELESVAYCGKSALIAADGSFVARTGENEETVIFGELEVGAPPRAHAAPLAVDERTRQRLEDPAKLLRRARIAFSNERDGTDLARFAELARLADADVFVNCGKPSDATGEAASANGPIVKGQSPHAQSLPVSISLASIDRDSAQVIQAAGLTAGVVGEAILENPAGLVAARLDGLDLFVARVADANDPQMVSLARTRAAELRCFLVVIGSTGVRAFAVDPDGVVVAGTYDGYRVAGFAYDRARSEATTVAPFTDVLAGLQTAARIRKETTSFAT